MAEAGSHNGSRLGPMAELIGDGAAAGFDLQISPDGRLTRRENGLNFRFSFRFRDRAFNAEANALGDEVRLRFTGEFGVLPFTLEDRTRRQEILSLLPELRRAGLSCEITPANGIRVGGELSLTGVTAPREILAAVIEQLILSRAYLDTMAELAYVPVKLPVRRR